jgi:hypothetical protein
VIIEHVGDSAERSECHEKTVAFAVEFFDLVQRHQRPDRESRDGPRRQIINRIPKSPRRYGTMRSPEEVVPFCSPVP